MNTGENLHIISGGPGSGKSSLLAALQRGGCKTMPEDGRAIIQEQVAIGGTTLPWANRLPQSKLAASQRKAYAITDKAGNEQFLEFEAVWASSSPHPEHVREFMEFLKGYCRDS